MAPPVEVNLNEEQLRKLAKKIYDKEVEAINFQSEQELAKYLSDCKSGYGHVVSILDAGGEVEIKHRAEPTKAPIAHDIYSYLLKAVNISLQSVKSFIMRLKYLEKIREHSASIIKVLESLDPTNLINVASLAEAASKYKQLFLQYNTKYQSIPYKVFTWFSDHGYTFEELVQRHQRLLNFGGSFKDLEDAQKLQVYNKIIVASGLGDMISVIDVALGVAGIAVLVFTAGMMVWDIYLSEHKIKTAAQDTLMLLTPIASSMIGTIFATSIETLLIGVVVVPAVVITVTGCVAGIMAGFIIAKIGNYLIDWIFGSEGTATGPQPPLLTDEHRFYKAEMPDNEGRLALQIAHQSIDDLNV